MSPFTRRRALLAAGGVGLVASIALGSALAAVRLQSSTRISGRQIDLVKALSGSSFTTQAPGEWVDVPGAGVAVSPSAPAFVLIRFAGAARCDDAHSHGQY